MGAINFSIDINLIKKLKANLNIDIFVETGTFQGDTIEIVKDYFTEIYTTELSTEYYEQSKARFINFPHIHVLHGDSAQKMKELNPILQYHPTLFWLDAHWCVASNTAGELSQCPLLEEIEAIGRLDASSVIIIDDARLFLAPPPIPHEVSQWPSFDDIVTSLKNMSLMHSLIVLNDNIIFFPKAITDVISKFATEYGFDLLSVLDKSRDYDKLLIQLNEKEQEIKRLKIACDEREAIILAQKNDKNILSNSLKNILNKKKLPMNQS